MGTQTLLILLATGLVAGMLSGFAGVGGGVIIVPLLMFFMGFSQLEAQGTSLAVLLPPVGIMATMVYYRQGHINWKYAVIIGLGFLIGGYLGGKIAVRLDQRLLKKLFGILLLIISLRILIKK